MPNQDPDAQKLLSELESLRHLAESFSLLEEERRCLESEGVAEHFRLGWQAKTTREIFYRIALNSPHLDYIAPGCGDLFGYNAQEMKALEVGGLIQEAELAGAGKTPAPFVLNLRQLGDQHRYRLDYLVRTKDGGSKWVADYCHPWLGPDGQVRGSQGLLRDISQRKQLEEALKQSERRLDSILRSVPDIIYRLDADGFITYISDSIRRYGHEPWELMGGSILDLVYPQDREDARRQILERRTGDRATTNLEVRLLRGPYSTGPDWPTPVVEGEYRYFRVSAQGLWTEKEREKGSRFLGSQGIARDVTDMKIAEEERLLREKVQAAIATAGGACHELNQPLQSIMAQTELLLLKLPPSSPLKSGLQVILEQARRMADITLRLNRITQFQTQPYLQSSQILDIKRSCLKEEE